MSIEKAALEDLAALLLERAGLKIAADGYHGLRLALRARMPALGITDAGEYVRKLRAPSGEAELRSLMPLVTVGHTEFFRDPKQFAALERRLLPEGLEQARKEGRPFALWSAGCATGEEPYSLAMLLREQGASPSEIRLRATDVNPAAVESARQGRFPARRVHTLPEERIARHFVPSPEGYLVVPEVKAFIDFGGQNLAASSFEGVGPQSLDIILCRNVIIYFDLPTIRGLMDRFHDSLRPGGILLLGYSESLFKVYDRFDMIEVEGAFLYQRPQGIRRGRRLEPRRITPEAPPDFPSLSDLRKQQMESVGKVSPVSTSPAPPIPARAAAPPVSPTPPARVGAPAAPSLGVHGARLDDAIQALERGDFSHALQLLEKRWANASDDLACLLTLGNVHSLLGHRGEAHRCYKEVLAKEPLCVEARIYGALAELQNGEPEAAKSDLGKVLFLEPSLAIVHYLSGQVHELLGDREAARRAYRNALGLQRMPQRPLVGFYPDLPSSPEHVARAAEYALDALDAEGRKR